MSRLTINGRIVQREAFLSFICFNKLLKLKPFFLFLKKVLDVKENEYLIAQDVKLTIFKREIQSSLLLKSTDSDSACLPG